GGPAAQEGVRERKRVRADPLNGFRFIGRLDPGRRTEEPFPGQRMTRLYTFNQRGTEISALPPSSTEPAGAGQRAFQGFGLAGAEKGSHVGGGCGRVAHPERSKRAHQIVAEG